MKSATTRLPGQGVVFLSDARAQARTTLVFGYDRFNDKIFQNAYASGSDYRIQGTTAITPVGRSCVPRVSARTRRRSCGRRSNRRAAARTCGCTRYSSTTPGDSNAHLSVNLGVRWDKNQAQDGGGAVVANKGLLSPRFAAVWDPTADGRWTINASYARYVMPMTSNVAASTTAAGNSVDFRLALPGAGDQSESGRRPTSSGPRAAIQAGIRLV